MLAHTELLSVLSIDRTELKFFFSLLKVGIEKKILYKDGEQGLIAQKCNANSFCKINGSHHNLRFQPLSYVFNIIL